MSVPDAAKGMGMSEERLDLDALAVDYNELYYDWKKDAEGNQILFMDFEDGQRLLRLLKAMPRLIQAAEWWQEEYLTD